jgi:hypothetical protein
MTGLVFLLCVFACYRLTTLVTRDTILRATRRRLAKRYPPRIVSVLDDAGNPAMIRNGNQGIESAVTTRAHWVVEFVHCERCVSVWASGVLVLGAHGLGLLDPWALVGLGWLGVAGGVALIVDVAG